MPLFIPGDLSPRSEQPCETQQILIDVFFLWPVEI